MTVTYVILLKLRSLGIKILTFNYLFPSAMKEQNKPAAFFFFNLTVGKSRWIFLSIMEGIHYAVFPTVF